MKTIIDQYGISKVPENGENCLSLWYYYCYYYKIKDKINCLTPSKMEEEDK